MIDPYRILFPAGLLLGILGALCWVFFGLGLSPEYPGALHASVMMGGFLATFATGFLMTAIPRFVGAAPARAWEIAAAAAFAAGCAIAFLARNVLLLHLFTLGNLGFLAAFAGRRFRDRAQDPPDFFIFVGGGLLCGIGGSALLAASDLGWVTGAGTTLGRILLFHGMMLSLVIGVGGKLVPVLLGRESQAGLRISRRISRVDPDLVAMSLLLYLSFALEAFFEPQTGRLLRASVFTWVAFSHWKLQHVPVDGSRLGFWVWTAGWALFGGLWIHALFPAYAIHGIHLAFIGGLGLLTLMVGTRVTLAHGGHGLALETDSKALLWTGILMSFAALTRLVAPLIPSAYLHHLAYAGLLWIAGLLVWGTVFGAKLAALAKEEPDAGEC